MPGISILGIFYLRGLDLYLLHTKTPNNMSIKTPENYRLLARHVFNEKKDYFIPCYQNLSEAEQQHIADIAASVMMTRDNVMMGGGFAHSIVGNDLRGAFDRADSTIVLAIRFMVYVMHHVQIESPTFERVLI
jgi:hypothetical protein